MRFARLAIVVLTCTFAVAAAEAGSGETTIVQERPVSGVVSDVNAAEQTIWLGPLRFYVPGIELASILLPIGVAYLILVGDQRTVTRWSVIVLIAAIGQCSGFAHQRQTRARRLRHDPGSH